MTKDKSESIPVEFKKVINKRNSASRSMDVIEKYVIMTLYNPENAVMYTIIGSAIGETQRPYAII